MTNQPFSHVSADYEQKSHLIEWFTIEVKFLASSDTLQVQEIHNVWRDTGSNIENMDTGIKMTSTLVILIRNCTQTVTTRPKTNRFSVIRPNPNLFLLIKPFSLSLTEPVRRCPFENRFYDLVVNLRRRFSHPSIFSQIWANTF